MWASTMMRGPLVPCVAMIEPRPSKVIDDGEGPHLLDHHLANRLLESRRAGRVREQPQQLHGPILRADGGAAGDEREDKSEDARGHRCLQVSRREGPESSMPGSSRRPGCGARAGERLLERRHHLFLPRHAAVDVHRRRRPAAAPSACSSDLLPIADDPDVTALARDVGDQHDGLQQALLGLDAAQARPRTRRRRATSGAASRVSTWAMPTR